VGGVFADNQSDIGGGIYNEGTLTMTRSADVAHNYASGDGGGIYQSGTATLTDIVIQNNTAGITGGGIYSPYGGTTETGVTYTGNVPD